MDNRNLYIATEYFFGKILNILQLDLFEQKLITRLMFPNYFYHLL